MIRAAATTLTLAALGLAILLSLPSDGQALSCAGLTKENSEGSFVRADGAITGKVVARRSVEIEQGNGVSSVSQVTVYRIGRSFKKKRRLTPGTRLRVWGPVEQRVGSRGGILLDRHKGKWTGSLCSQIDRPLLRQTARSLGRI